MIKFLVELGNKLDKLGHLEGADLVDEILSKMASNELPHDEDWDDEELEGPTDEELMQIEEESEEEGELTDTLEDLLTQINALKGMLDRDDVPEDFKRNILPGILEGLEETVRMITEEQPALGASREDELRGLPFSSSTLPIAEASKE